MLLFPSLWAFLESLLLVVNALAVLNEERFLNKSMGIIQQHLWIAKTCAVTCIWGQLTMRLHTRNGNTIYALTTMWRDGCDFVCCRYRLCGMLRYY